MPLRTGYSRVGLENAAVCSSLFGSGALTLARYISPPLSNPITPRHLIRASITTPVVFALKKYYIQGLEKITDILNHFWIKVAVSILKPPHGGFRSETAAT
jgi:hypothetical protein